MKTTIGNESSTNLSAHSTGNADGELWLWSGVNGYGFRQWGVNEGRYGCAYCVRAYYTRNEAVAELRKMRRMRAEHFELASR